LGKFLNWLNLQFKIFFLFFTVLDTAGQEVSLNKSLMAWMLMHSLRVLYKNKLFFCSAWHFICDSPWASFNLKSCFYLYFSSLIYFCAGGGSHGWGAWIYQLWGYNSMYRLAVPECKPPGHTKHPTQGSCVLGAPRGTWCLAFAHGRLRNLSFCGEIKSWAPWFSQVQSIGNFS